MIGQKHETPDENDGSRLFYTSLLRQKPASKMALQYCLEHGLLSEDQAKQAVKKLK